MTAVLYILFAALGIAIAYSTIYFAVKRAIVDAHEQIEATRRP